MRTFLPLLICLGIGSSSSAFAQHAPQPLSVSHDDTSGKLTVKLGDRELFGYNYGKDIDLPHYYPLNTPSGKNLLVQQTQPYPHHRSFWISDTVEKDGVKGDVYNAYYSGKKVKDKTFEPPFRSGSRHVSFDITTGTDSLATIQEKLVWETNRATGTIELVDENRTLKIFPVKENGYFIDLSFTLTASYGEVKFVSDPVHYAWPFLRINNQFSGEAGGTITDDKGTTGQAATNLKPALWMDYSNSVDGVAEGVAVFQYPDGGPPRKWLTRDYGTFGPRRPEHQSGKPFVLKNGESLSQRVGIYVHTGNVETGKVADTYQRYIEGKLQ